MVPFCQALAEKAPFVVISFDQRNHGERLLDKDKNGGWESPSHVNDMYSTQVGTARDIRFASPSSAVCSFGKATTRSRSLSFLIDLLPSFLGFKPKSYGVIGVSLGGHVVLLSMAGGMLFFFFFSR